MSEEDLEDPRGPAYRIRSPRLVIRCWNPADAPLLEAAIAGNLEHLRPWMPWAHAEPEPLQAKVERLRRFRGEFDLGTDFVYGIFSPREREVLGGTGLHTRAGKYAREIGYWIHRDHAGRGLATEATAALTRVAFEVDGMERVEIRCDPANQRSARVPERLGFIHEATLRSRERAPDGQPRDTMVWTMLADEYERSIVREVEIEAYDAMNRRLPMSPARRTER